jgi:hypothetical protein
MGIGCWRISSSIVALYHYIILDTTFRNTKLKRGIILKKAILCECGDFVEGHTFKDYIPTSIGPSTPTFGHSGCGLIFDLVDGELPKRFSSRIQLKGIAMRFAKMNKMEDELVGTFLLEVDRLKSRGNLSDIDILIAAHKAIQEKSNVAEDGRQKE